MSAVLLWLARRYLPTRCRNHVPTLFAFPVACARCGETIRR